jgi:hypothetical protein
MSGRPRRERILEQLAKDARESYLVVRRHTRYRPMFKANHGHRERFQLLAAALIYSSDATRRFKLGGLHRTGEPAETPGAWTTGHPLLASPEIRAGMDSASSSFRIITALELAEAPVGRSPQRLSLLIDASKIPCQKVDGAQLSVDQCLAILAAHRDSFGHGEDGDNERPWHEHRREHFIKICHCRVIEAQLHQIAICFRELGATL